jgi:hypothetical protein
VIFYTAVGIRYGTPPFGSLFLNVLLQPTEGHLRQAAHSNMNIIYNHHQYFATDFPIINTMSRDQRSIDECLTTVLMFM